jgi:hypothetical protein
VPEPILPSPPARRALAWQLGRVLLVLALLVAGGGAYLILVGLPAGVEGDAPEGALPPAPEPPDVQLDAALAARLVGLSLACQERPFPYKPGHVHERPEDARPHPEFTPAFSGCFDWHSAVHGLWTMARVLRLRPELGEADRLRAGLAARLAPGLLERELLFFREPRNRTFERPYGWGWLLRLQAELITHPEPDVRGLAAALEPLAALLAGNLIDYLERLSVPIRDGTHQSTAFALLHALAYARAAGDASLEAAVRRRARDFYLADRACPAAYEPSGEDFLSGCLTEAELMRRVLPTGEFRAWLEDFFPGGPLAAGFAPLTRPPEVRDPEDPRIGHLIGLGWSRAWGFQGLARGLPADHPWRAAFLALARLHRRDALERMFSTGYGGEHWLASFAVLALTDPDSE